MRRSEQEQMAALTLRVHARKTVQPITESMAWDAIAEMQTDLAAADIKVHPMSARTVLQIARIELRANGETHLIRSPS